MAYKCSVCGKEFKMDLIQGNAHRDKCKKSYDAKLREEQRRTAESNERATKERLNLRPMEGRWLPRGELKLHFSSPSYGYFSLNRNSVRLYLFYLDFNY